MASFTCISCHVAFREAAVQREHYKSDWHRYNLKRKVADLPPVTAEVFQQRVLEQRSNAAEREAARHATNYCQACGKKFGSDKSYANHLQSKKHQEKLLLKPPQEAKGSKQQQQQVRDVDEDEEMEDIETDSEEWEDDDDEALAPTSCMFCKQSSASIEESVRHMADAHSFFIPDVEFVVDLEGLLTYIGERIGQGRICLWCGHLGRQFPSTDAVQKHMLDKGHCKMFHEGEVLLEYSDFYDFSSSYPDQGDADDEVEENVLDGHGFELVLPSGATIGHRSLYRYYRQKLNSEARPRAGSRPALQHGNLFKTIGWDGASSRDVVAKKVRDTAFMRRLVTRHQLGLSVKANKLQKHYRPQVDF